MTMTTSHSRSIRTPLAKVRGLGASHSGTEHFWHQRVTAVSNLVLVIAFLAILIKVAGRDYAATIAVVSHPAVAVILILLVISASVHMRLGAMAIIEDYVHGKGVKMAAVILNTFFSIAVAATVIFAILKIALRGMP
jgi:succinate dehydrogenase / fumarate reductase membrane anchor subunit